MTDKNDQAEKKDQDQGISPEAEAEEEDFLTPEDLALEEVERELAEAERAEQGKQDDNAGAEDDTEAEEFKKVDAQADPKNADTTDKGEQAKDDQGEDAQDEKKDVVPLAALLKERRESTERIRELELELARREGALSASQKATGETASDQPSEAQKTPDQQIDELQTQIDAVWDQADDGDMSLKDARRKERELQDQIEALKKNQDNEAGQDIRQIVLDTRIEENLVSLEQQYPVLKGLDQAQMMEFVGRAYQQAEEAGEPIGNGALETMRLHNMAAKAAHDHYAQFFTNTNPQPAGDGRSQGSAPSQQSSISGQETGGKGLSKQARDRAAKLDLQAKHPPDINQIGSAAEGTLTDQQVLSKLDSMDEEEQIEFLEGLPSSLAQRLGVG